MGLGQKQLAPEGDEAQGIAVSGESNATRLPLRETDSPRRVPVFLFDKSLSRFYTQSWFGRKTEMSLGLLLIILVGVTGAIALSAVAGTIPVRLPAAGRAM